MNIELKFDLEGVDWTAFADVYERAPLHKRDPAQLKRAFENSFITCIALHDGKPVGAGRAISDGEYYSNIYDVVVLPEWQRKGVGRMVMEELVKRLAGKFILLTTTIGKEDFYRKLGFRKHKTAMAIYPSHKTESMRLYLENE